MRIILYTGKGGVGKTTLAASTAVRCSELGSRTLVISTDSASCLSDSFELPVKGRPTSVARNLWAQETEMDATVGKQWQVIREWLTTFLAGWGIEEIHAEEIVSLPGMEELANLMNVVNYTSRKEYDVIIVDCAPTGEALRLLSLPEVLQWWIHKLSRANKVGKVGQTILAPLVNLPTVREDVLDSIKHILGSLSGMKSVLTDPRITSVRLVVNPEKMVIKETQRFYTYLNLYGYLTDMVICNRVLPDSVEGGYFKSWRVSHEKHMNSIFEAFSPLPITTVPLLKQEPVGLATLGEVGKILYGKRDPAEFFSHRNAQQISKTNGHYNLFIDLPTAKKEEVGLLREGDELVVNVGKYRRNIILPRALAKAEIKRAAFKNDRLQIEFDGARKATTA